MGLDFWINERRQQIVFYKNLYRHFLKYSMHYNAHELELLEQDRIPKIIHYCWFGNGKQNDLIKKCIESWKEVLPEYDIVLWNEENFPYDKYPFAAQALKDRKWAFVSDVARLYALYYYGGVYMDTDVEVLKPLDPFLHHTFFSSYESDRHIPTGLMGAKKGSKYIDLLLSWYKDCTYGEDYYEIANTRIITRITRLNCGMKINGEQYNFANNYYYPRDYFCPSTDGDKWNITENTYAIHHFTGLW